MVQRGAEVKTAAAKTTLLGGHYSMSTATENVEALERECRMYKVIRNTSSLKVIAAIPCFNMERSIAHVVKHTKNTPIV